MMEPILHICPHCATVNTGGAPVDNDGNELPLVCVQTECHGAELEAVSSDDVEARKAEILAHPEAVQLTPGVDAE
jgi:hypothetical protein